MAPPAAHTCSSCGQPATLRCGGCSEGVDTDGNASSTYYCSKDCQVTDFKHHKSECKLSNARKQLYRGGDFLQRAFYAFREATFDIDLRKINFANGKMHLYERRFIPDINGPLFPFPNHFVTDEKQREALLAHQACNFALAYMFELIKKVLKGINTPTHPTIETYVYFQEKFNKIIHYRTDGPTDKGGHSHVYLAVSFKAGEEYALDLAGAQFDQFDAVLPLNKYNKDFIKKTVFREPLGAGAKFRKELCERKQDHRVPNTFDFRLTHVDELVAVRMNSAVKAWELAAGKNVEGMLSEKQSGYEADRDALLAVITREMREYVKEWEKNGPKLKYTITTKEQQDRCMAEALKAEWCYAAAGTN